MSNLSQTIVRPLDTEKSFAGQKNGKYTFMVSKTATKPEIKKAIEKYYGVKVKKVTTSIVVSKTRTIGRGRTLTKRPLGKKAIVTTVGAKAIDVNKIAI